MELDSARWAESKIHGPGPRSLPLQCYDLISHAHIHTQKFSWWVWSCSISDERSHSTECFCLLYHLVNSFLSKRLSDLTIFHSVGQIVHIILLKIASWFLKIVSRIVLYLESDPYLITFLIIILISFPYVLFIVTCIQNSKWRAREWFVPSLWLYWVWRFMRAVCIDTWQTC